ncbi:MAG TPA: hydantoinase/oxoprolinase family protein [Stellaceae bacterium]|nr:hydantoinase/oxoprolinase family protein [Stellaceae bacterium]
MIRLAFDIGGTFTDFVLHDDATGRIWSLKVPSTAKDPAEAVAAGLKLALAQADIELAAVDTVLHATTVATNAIIERKGAPAALITTAGFRDILIIGRQKRYETYDLYLDKPAPLVKRRHIYEIEERTGHDGQVITPLNIASVDRAIDALRADGRKSVAVSLLHAYANPEHERRIRDRIRERAPELLVTVSSDVSPKYREYERTNTAVVDAYVKPIVDHYIGRLERKLAARGFRHQLFVMQSSGGLVSPAVARQYPIRIVESGPAAGVLMCAEVGRTEGFENVLTFDMGGTTAKVGAIEQGMPAIVPTFEIDPIRYKKGSGLPVNVPAVELLEIGAGGGSIARTDMGMIVVGPESAGADPGPACYGYGGTQPTVTDANVALGYIAPDYFNGGAMVLDPKAAETAIATAVAAPLGLSVGEAAWGIHLVATANMEHALRLVSVERGRDPRGNALVAFGGAGPLHATRLARSIGVPRVIVPFGAGVGSAIGLLQADARIDVSVTRVLRMIPSPDEALARLYAELEARARRDLQHLGFEGEVRWSRYAYMRYSGQGFEVHVDLPEGKIGSGYGAKAAAAFHESYARRHKWSDPTAEVEGIDWALVATMATAHRWPGFAPSSNTVGPGRRGFRRAWFPEAGGFAETRVLDRLALVREGSIVGPAIIEDPDCTALLLPNDVGRLSAQGNLIIEIAKPEIP